MNSGHKTAVLLIFGLYILAAPIAYIGSIQYSTGSIPFTIYLQIAILYLLLVFGINTRVIIPDDTKVVLLSFLLPVMLSSLPLYVHIIATNPFYSDTAGVLREYIGRIINLALNLSIFILLISHICRVREAGNYLLFMYYALLIVAVLGGIWQYFGSFLGISFPDLGVKNQFHGVGDDIKLQFSYRLTSFFSEPSYYVAFVIDFLVLSILLVKQRWLLLLVISIGTVVVVASYSISGIVNLLALGLISVGLIVFPRKTRIRNNIYRAIVLVGTVALLTSSLATDLKVLAPYQDRIENRLLEGNDHRLDTIRKTIDIWLASDPEIIITGFGPGMFSQFKNSPIFLDGTSNNLYVDFLVENGLIGLLAILFFFWYFFKKSYRTLQADRKSIVSLLLVIHLAVSSMYRADFVSPRFWVIIFIVIHLLRDRAIYIPRSLTNSTDIKQRNNIGIENPSHN